MRTILCLTEWNANMHQTNNEMFMTFDGVANWMLKSMRPIGNKLVVADKDIAGEYDINASNLAKIMDYCERNSCAAAFDIKSDFGFQVFNYHFTLSTIKVHE